MPTLDSIVHSVRSGEKPRYEELRYAVCAFDVLLAQLDIEQNPVQLQEFFIAAELDPQEYIGWINDPENPESIELYKQTNRAINQDRHP